MKAYIHVLFLIHVIFSRKSDAIKDTTCYGSDPACTTHLLSCNNTKVIKIIKADFGYRSGCNANGLSSCSNTDCCIQKRRDCFKSFTVEELQIVSIQCTGKHNCSVNGMRKVDSACNGRSSSAYSRITYRCTLPVFISTSTTKTPTTTSTTATSTNTFTTTSTKTPSTSTSITTSAFVTTISQHINTTGPVPIPPSTENPDDDKQVSDGDGESNTGGIVGGIVGILVVIVIVVIVIILYRRKAQQKSNSEIPEAKTVGTVDPHYFTVDDNATLNRNVTSEYDEIDLDADTLPQYSEGYDHILAQQIKASKSKQNSNSNHIGNGTEPATDDDYNLLNRNKLQKADPALAATYQHIGEDPETNSKSKNNFITEDNYQHIGEIPANNFKTNLISEDNYQHIGVNPANNSKNNLITEDNYQHIGSPEVQLNQDGDDYNHIGNVMISRDTTITKNTDNNGGSVTPRTFRPNSEYQLAYSPNGGDVKQTDGYEIATLVENQNTESDYELARKSDC